MNNLMNFVGFPKIARLRRQIVVTEKIDGTNAQVNIRVACEAEGKYNPRYDHPYLDEKGDEPVLYYVRAGSRVRWICPDDDNFGFARWVWDNTPELVELGPGAHFGEWWGSKIQRGYGLSGPLGRRFSLFNVGRWTEENKPIVCDVVPTLYTGTFDLQAVDACLEWLHTIGSAAKPGYMNPEGIILYHTDSHTMYKQTLDNDRPKNTMPIVNKGKKLEA